jgi:thiamine biosynthesis protein ThiI
MILVRFGEIFLKGENKIVFEQKLVSNIKESLKHYGVESSVKRDRTRVYVENDNAVDALKPVFGIVSFSVALKLEIDLEKIKQKVCEILSDMKPTPKTFRISSQRVKKDFKLTSPEINVEVGAYIVEKLALKVKLVEPDVNVGIEIIDDAYIFTESIRGQGGLPAGVEGNVITLIDSENSFKAAYLMLKRGCNVYPVSFNQMNIEKLQSYLPSASLTLVKDNNEIYNLAQKVNAKAVVTAETIDTLHYSFDMLTLRPLVVKTQQEIDSIPI